MVRRVGLVSLVGAFLVVASPRFVPSAAGQAAKAPSKAGALQAPIYVWDPTWPKQAVLPNNWVTGATVGVAVDAKDHIWVVHRPAGAVSGTQGECCVPAPSVIEFDQAGSLVQAWGGPRPEQLAAGGRGRGTTPATLPKISWTPPTNFEWVTSEHNVFVDYKDNVWLGNYGGSHILKFNRQGKLLLQIGKPNAKGQGSNDTDVLASPTGITVDPKANEVYVADGYGNRRVIVFDADTGAYKRHWGAYGKKPDDTVVEETRPGGPPSQQFHTVHCVQIDKDDLVWVCDRANYRIQVFKKDGTFVKEVSINPLQPGQTPMYLNVMDGKGGTSRGQLGTVFDLAFSRDPEQRFFFVPDGRGEKVWILRRSDMKVVGSIGHPGHWGGAFTLAHNIGSTPRTTCT